MNDASKRGLRAKRSGYNSEKRLERLFSKWKLECWRQPLSGAIKKKGFEGDLVVSIYGRFRKVENKRRADFERFYRFVGGGKVVIIDGFCVLVSQDTFYGLINAKKPGVVVTILDKQFKGLRGFFQQDNVDLVTMVSPYKLFIFAMSLPLWEELWWSAEDVA